MSFDNPQILFLLFLPAACIPFLFFSLKKGKTGAALIAAAYPPGERKTAEKEIKLRIFFSKVFFFMFVSFIIIALAGPNLGQRTVADYRRGIDLVLAFDLSRSMNAADCPPSGESDGFENNVSRLERGRAIALEIVNASGGIRLAAAAGKGRGVLAVPLTYDSETILSFLHSMDFRAVSGNGTNLESILDAALNAFGDSVPNRRVVLLFSDGEALSGSFRAAVDRAANAGIILCAAALGSETGAPVPVTRGEDAPLGYLLDKAGRQVISTRQSEPLKEAALKTGGIFVDGGRGDASAEISGYIKSISTEAKLHGYRREANPRRHIFIFMAAIFLACARLMGFRRKKNQQVLNTNKISASEKKQRENKAGKLLSLLPLALIFSSCAETQGKLLVMEGNFFSSRGFHTEAISSYLKALSYEDSAPYAEYGLGTAYFALEEGSSALERYRTAQTEIAEINPEDHRELRFRILYNSGIIYYERGEYEDAAAAFRGALKADSSRVEAKRNLELTLLTIDRVNTPESAPPSAGGGIAEENSAPNTSAVFDYLREKEQEQWRSREWQAESEPDTLDY